jgi:hypothetical protein
MSELDEPQDPLLVQLHDARLDQQDAHTEAVRLIRHLYVDLGQDAGGPLHVVLDDGNVGDFWLHAGPHTDGYDRYGYLFNGDFARWSQAGDDVSLKRRNAIRDTCEQILALLRPMSEQHRRDAINEFWKGWRP